MSNVMLRWTDGRTNGREVGRTEWRANGQMVRILDYKSIVGFVHIGE